MIETRNGDLIFDENSGIPPDQEGYYRDINNPWILHKSFIDCIHRIENQKKLPCGKIEQTFSCELLKILVGHKFCVRCRLPKK